jgi:hypothetical protein
VQQEYKECGYCQGNERAHTHLARSYLTDLKDGQHIIVLLPSESLGPALTGQVVYLSYIGNGIHARFVAATAVHCIGGAQVFSSHFEENRDTNVYWPLASQLPPPAGYSAYVIAFYKNQASKPVLIMPHLLGKQVAHSQSTRPTRASQRTTATVNKPDYVVASLFDGTSTALDTVIGSLGVKPRAAVCAEILPYLRPPVQERLGFFKQPHV